MKKLLATQIYRVAVNRNLILKNENTINSAGHCTGLFSTNRL